MSAYDEFSHLMALHAQQQIGVRRPFAIGHVVAYDPSSHQVQCAISSFAVVDPATGIATGQYAISPWAQLGSDWVGNGWGFQAAPEVGDAATPWSGTQCALYIQSGDSGETLAGQLLYTAQAVPPDSTLVAGEAVFRHKSGTRLKFHDDGQLEVYSANNINITTAGGISFQFNDDGSIAVTVAGGKTYSINGSSDAAALVSLLVTAFNAHTHQGVQTGGGTSGTPTSPWSASTIESAVLKLGG
jgi:hypothetical protein